MPSYKVQTYGCQMNYSDTERIETYLEAMGYDKAETIDTADLILFNTCSIRQKAEDRVLGQMKILNRLRRKRPEMLVAITGCMVRTSSSRYSSKRDKLFHQASEVDICLRIEELPKLGKLIREIQPESKIESIEEEDLEDYFHIKASYTTSPKAQAYLPISTGCDKFCTYCIVPFSRGRERNRNIEEVIQEAKQLVANGTKEIMLIGQTVNSYGFSVSDKLEKRFSSVPEGKEPFVYLLEELDKLNEGGLERVRFTSPHPRDMSDQLIDAMADLKTQMPYLHLPVQAGENAVLKRMNRTYTVEKYIDSITKLREKIPDISITTDIIVGFCGETEEEYETTYDFFKDLKFEHAYISQYSERKGTFASKNMPDDIPQKVKKERWHRLNELLKEHSVEALNRFVGKTVNVLVESQEGKVCLGRSEHFKTVQFASGRDLIGEIVPVKITGSQQWLLEGELV